MRGQRPIVMSHTPQRRSMTSLIKRESFVSASIFLHCSLAGVSTSINGNPTYDSGIINDMALSTFIPIDSKRFSIMLTASPTVSPAVHTM